jgi:phosphoribosylanthranilate isomerase
MLKIKVCGITDPVNAVNIAGTCPDYMGFIFHPASKRYVGTVPDATLFSRIPCGILKTGVFVNEYPGIITAAVPDYGLDVVQLHGNESPGYCRLLREAGLKIIKAFRMNPDFNFRILQSYEETCDCFLFDSFTGSGGGSGLKFDWKILDNYLLDKPFFLSGGVGPEDIQKIKEIRHFSFLGVDINSRFEISPGIKDHKKVNDFIKLLKNSEQ